MTAEMRSPLVELNGRSVHATTPGGSHCCVEHPGVLYDSPKCEAVAVVDLLRQSPDSGAATSAGSPSTATSAETGSSHASSSRWTLDSGSSVSHQNSLGGGITSSDEFADGRENTEPGDLEAGGLHKQKQPDVVRRLVFGQHSRAASAVAAAAAEQTDALVRMIRPSLGKEPNDLAVPLLLGDSAQGHAEEGSSQHVYWEGVFVVISMFCGYSALFGLQHEVKARLHIADDLSLASKHFGVATSALYIFNLIFRFGHNIFFGCISPRARVFVAMLSMTTSMVVIVGPIMIMGCRSVLWVVLAYSLGGIGVGSFEANFLNCLTPLGHRTKHIAISGIPIGNASVLVGCFFLMGPPLRVEPTAIYAGVTCLILCGMAVLHFRIPDMTPENKPGMVRRNSMMQLKSDAGNFRDWLPQLWSYPLASTIDMFTISAFAPGVVLFMYTKETVALTSSVKLQTDIFLAIFNGFGMLGGLTGRILSYWTTPRHPLKYNIFSFLGMALILIREPLLAPLGSYCILFGDGLIYGSITRYIDTSIPSEFNLTALSFWLFIGDFGSVAGSNCISYISDWVAVAGTDPWLWDMIMNSIS